MGMEMLGASLIMAGSAALSSHAQSRSAAKQASAQNAATQQAKENAARTAEQQREQMRMQNEKTADVSKILEQNSDPMLSGGSTLLTGAEGVDNSGLLGKKSSLG